MFKALRYLFIGTLSLVWVSSLITFTEGKPKAKKEPNQETAKENLLPQEVPPDLSKEEVALWKEGHPPGWSHGVKAGWKGGEMPPGLAKKRNLYPPGWKKWSKNERSAWENELKIAIEVVLGKAEKVRIYTKAEIDLILFSFEMTARKGVPIKTVRNLVEKSVKKKMKVEGIETSTRALTYGVGKDVDFDHLEKFVNRKMDRGVKDEELTFAIYKQIEKSQKEVPVENQGKKGEKIEESKGS